MDIRRKKASLAINAIIRGLELDQVAFHYDETANLEPARLLGHVPFSEGRDCGDMTEATSS